MKSYSLKWNKNIKEIVLSYKFLRKLYLDDLNMIKKLGLGDVYYETYNIFKLSKDVDFFIKSIEVDNNSIQKIELYLLSNKSDLLNKEYYRIIDKPNKESFYTLVINNDNKGFFFDDNIGIVKNFDRCFRCPKAMLSDIDNLKDIFKLSKRNDGYYINNNKYMNIDEYEYYSNKVFDLLGKEALSNTLYYTIRHFGPYENIKETYSRLLELIKKDGVKIIGLPMEEYICGRWNSDDEGSYVTNIMIPVESVDI